LEKQEERQRKQKIKNAKKLELILVDVTGEVDSYLFEKHIF
jgi:hypothetical protein